MITKENFRIIEKKDGFHIEKFGYKWVDYIFFIKKKQRFWPMSLFGGIYQKYEYGQIQMPVFLSKIDAEKMIDSCIEIANYIPKTFSDAVEYGQILSLGCV